MFAPGRDTVEIGDLTLHRLVEFEVAFLPAKEVLPGLTDEILDRHRSWLRPHALDAKDFFRFGIQCHILRTPHHTILIDSCVGNHKNLAHPLFRGRDDATFPNGLKALGLGVEDIDFVMCTHLHLDHVGWNTRREDGRWVPTFPNARYIFGREEYERGTAEPEVRPHFVDSVLPIVAAQRADLVEADFTLGDHLRVLPTPGHTPGHFAFEAGRGKAEAVFTGDLVHVPLQMRHPELSAWADADPALSARTRRAFFERYCDTPTLCCTAHFPSRSAGFIRRWEDGFRLTD